VILLKKKYSGPTIPKHLQQQPGQENCWFKAWCLLLQCYDPLASLEEKANGTPLNLSVEQFFRPTIFQAIRVKAGANMSLLKMVCFDKSCKGHCYVVALKNGLKWWSCDLHKPKG
jgi:hypothetical protein